jgi:hypothetical protein
MVEGRPLRRKLKRPTRRVGYWAKLHSLAMHFVAYWREAPLVHG